MPNVNSLKIYIMNKLYCLYRSIFCERVQLLYEFMHCSINIHSSFICFFFVLAFPGVNMGYMENNYSNSNNGGSVNSQDSLWQVKMSAAAVGNQQGMVQAPMNQYVEQQPAYGYDPLTHGGYGAVDDYAPYPHLTATPSQVGDEYHNLRNSQNPSRQDYCSDPYASVQKPKKRVDQHLGKPPN